jgi:Rieske Fe-S protein
LRVGALFSGCCCWDSAHFFVGTLLSVPLIRFALFPLLRRTTELKQSPVGALADFSSLTEPVMRTIQIEQVDGWRKAVSEKAVYVTKDSQGQLRVLTSICPHLGCTVPWNKEKKSVCLPMSRRYVCCRWNSRQRALIAGDGYTGNGRSGWATASAISVLPATGL